MDLAQEDYFHLSRCLENCHNLFYTMWNLGVPIFKNNISTAAIVFGKEGETLQFVFNPDYWERLTEYERIFVICHECLHVILHHGWRTKDVEEADRQISNVGLDIVVNHTLVDHFFFDRSKLTMDKELCWVDTVFPGTDVLVGDTFEYYFNLLRRAKQTANLPVFSGGSPGDGQAGLKLPDDHDALREGDWDDLIGDLSDGLSEEDKDSVREVIHEHYEMTPLEQTERLLERGEDGENGDLAGTGSTGLWKFIKVEKVKRKRKWESVIKEWSRRYDRLEFYDVEQWARINRRFAMIGNELMLPTEMEQEYELDGKIDVWFYQDTSGSCEMFKDRFFAAAMSLNPKRFEMRLFCFDTAVYETSLESRQVRGFGGTAYQPLEAEIQRQITADHLKYPRAIFVITDGEGTPIKPQFPERWYFFLTRDCLTYIPPEAKVFMLADFE